MEFRPVLLQADQRGQLLEAFPALVGLVVVLLLPVPPQGAGFEETLRAKSAAVAEFAVVMARVTGQTTGVFEGFIAMRTLEGGFRVVGRRKRCGVGRSDDVADCGGGNGFRRAGAYRAPKTAYMRMENRGKQGPDCI